MKNSLMLKFAGFCTAIFLLISSGNLTAMEAVIAEEAATVGIRLEPGASAALAESMATEMGAVDKVTLEGMSGELKGVLNSEIKASLKNISASLEKKTVSAAEAGSFGKTAGAELKSNFAKSLEGSEALTVNDLDGLKKFSFSEKESAVIQKIQPKSSTLALPEGTEANLGKDQLASLENKTGVASDTVVEKTNQEAGAMAEKADAIAKGDTKAVQASDQKLGTLKNEKVAAKKDFEAKNTELKKVKAEKVSVAQEKENTAVTNAESAAKSDEPESAVSAKQDALDAQDTTKKATADKAATDRTSAKQRYDQAKSELDGLNKERDTINEKLKNAQPGDVKTLQEQKGLLDEDIIQKEAAVTTARDAWLDTTSEWEMGARLKRRVGWGKDWTATTLKEKGLQLLADTPLTLINAVLFMLPSVGMSVWQEWIGKGSLVETLKKPQKFGNIWMKIPDDFVNEEQPSQSKFIYVGLDTYDRELTSKYLKTANYYVSKPEFGTPGNEAITDAGFPGKMLHLNTGFVFVGDGNAADSDKPTIPLLEPAVAGNSRDTTLKSIIETLAQGMRGGVSSQSTRLVGLQTEDAGYDGNQLIASLFSVPSKAGEFAYPAVMQATINALQSGANFGPFKLRAFRQLPKVAVDQFSSALNIPPIPLSKNNTPFVARGVYVYETQDTPFIKTVLDRIRPEDQAAAVLHKELVDYVVVVSLDKNYAVVPLEVPVARLDGGHFATYAVDPDASSNFYLLSLINPEGFYGFDGQQKEVPAIKLPELPLELASQIDLVKKYVAEKLKYGPFLYGSAQLFIDEGLANDGVFVYRVPNFLAEGIDDYVVALERGKTGMQATSLPNPKVQLFVSLVTSRFYDSGFKPYTKETAFWVVRSLSDAKNMRVTTKKPAANEQVVMSAKSPLYTLFVGGDVNPNNKLIPATAGIVKLPVNPYWALENVQYNESVVVEAELSSSAPDLLKKIQTQHEAWKELLDAQDPMAISNAMGPFTFAQSTQPIQLVATSEADVRNGNYVYTSEFYPDELLVMSSDASGTQDFATEFVFGTPQRYAISISSGNVYDAQKNGVRIAQIKDVNALAKRAQGRPFLSSLGDRLSTLQKLYAGQMIKQLCGPDTAFGPFELYINREDFNNDQFIYADVTGLGSPLNANGSENGSVVGRVRDYFVCVAQEPQRDADGKEVRDKEGNRLMQSRFGVQMSGDVTQVISLVSGGVYDRGGVYLGAYQQFDFANLDSTSPLENTTKILDVISKNSGKPLRPAIQAIVTKLTKPEYDVFLAEKKEIEALKDQEAALYRPLDKNVKANIDAAKYIPENPALPSRYLKLVEGKYYKLIPGDPKTGSGATYVDFNRGSGKDSGIGAVFAFKDSQEGGVTQLVTPLKGWALAMARLAAGVKVESDGRQRLGIGLMHAELPIKTKSGIVLSKTSIPAKVAGGVSSDFYYNSATDNFYAMMSRGARQVLVDISSGFAYTPAGIPAMNEGNVFVGPQESDFLLVGNDEYGLLKIVKHMAKLSGDVDHDVYVQSGPSLPDLNDETVNQTDMENYVTLKGIFNNHKSVMYNMVSEKNPEESTQIFKVVFDNVGRRMAQPYWVIRGADKKLVGPYRISENIHFSALAYLQTRAAGSDQYAGSFVESDYLTQDGKPKTVIILFDSKDQSLKGIVFGDQFVELKGRGGAYTASYQDQNGKSVSASINVERDEVSGGRWITITSVGKVCDYAFDSLVFDILPEASCEENSLNLYCMKNEWKLNASSIIENSRGATALLSQLNPEMGAGTVKLPETINSGERDAILSNAAKIMLDPSGIVYQNGVGVAGLRAKRFVYQFSQDDASFDWYDPTLKGWYVDLSNGALYRPLVSGAFPVGRSLLASQLAELLGKLGLRIGVDAKTGLSKSLVYHGLAATQDASGSKKVAMRRIQKPAMQRAVRVTGSETRGVNRLVQPVKIASRNPLRV